MNGTRRKLLAVTVALLAGASVYAGVAGAHSNQQQRKPHHFRKHKPPRITPRLKLESAYFSRGKLYIWLRCRARTYSGTETDALIAPSVAHGNCVNHEGGLVVSFNARERSAINHRGLRIHLVFRSGAARTRKTIMIRKAHRGHDSAAAPMRSVRPRSLSAELGTFDQHWLDTTETCVGSGSPTGPGQLSIYPQSFATLGANYGEPVWWRAWVYVDNGNGNTAWVPEQWREYTPYPNGAETAGAGLVSSGGYVWSFVGGTSAPGVDPAPAMFTVTRGYYAWGLIERWTERQGYAWASVQVDPQNVVYPAVYQAPNWCLY